MENEKRGNKSHPRAKTYSHSKLSTFEQCKLKYKMKYIDKIRPEIEKSIEAHLGTCVHDSLEWLYKEVKRGMIPSVDSLIIHYSQKWEKEYKPEMVIVRKDKTAKDYYNKGVKFLLDYYTKHYPFDDNTLELEKKVEIFLKNYEYKLYGFIDRLTYNSETGEYEIHDYKTSSSLPTKEKIEKDRQLALYSIAIKELFGHDKPVKLNWHFLDFNHKISSNRTKEELESLKNDTIRLIEEIESTTDFPANPTKLCDWCEFKNQCPYWNKESNIKTSVEEAKEKIKSGNLTQEQKEKYPTLSKYLRG